MSCPAKSMGCGKSKTCEEKDGAAKATSCTAGACCPKVIVVIGATGQQGGSVIKAMKDDKHFVIKAATRNPDSDKAKELAKQGIELVKLDLDNADSCKDALKGAYGVFLVTNYWEIFDMQREIQQGKNVVDAAKANNVQHLVFSGLQSAKEAIGDDRVRHFETKKVIFDYIVEQGVPYTVVDYAAYYENFIGGMVPRKNENSEYVLQIPMGKVPLDMVCISETGEIVHQVFLRQGEYKGQWLKIASQRYTIEEYAAVLSKAFAPKKFVAGTVTPEQFAKFGFPGADDLAAMFEFYISGKCLHDVELTRKLHPGIPTFEQWVEANRAALEAVFQ